MNSALFSYDTRGYTLKSQQNTVRSRPHETAWIIVVLLIDEVRFARHTVPHRYL